MNKSVIAGNFSKYASSYDRNAVVQSEAAAMLSRLLPKDGVQNILEIGCGTGNYTALISRIYKDAGIKAIDISSAMIKAARQRLSEGRAAFEVADAEAFDLAGEYDLITSNAAFHWFSDLDGVIKKAEGSLKDGGALIFSSFGPKTYLELKAALHAAIGRAFSFTPDAFPGKQDLERKLAKYFKTIKVAERIIRESYPSLRDLLNRIKYSGTRGAGADIGRSWSPGLLKKIEDNYLERFGSIEATYQIFFCEAKK